MMRKLLVIAHCLLLVGMATAQDEKMFPVAVKENMRRYNSISNAAYERGDTAEGQFLFDTLVNNQLVGTRFEDYTLKRLGLGGGKLKLSSIKKPVMIQTYATWCVFNKGEIAALNKLARKYSKDVKIVVVFWDRKQAAKAMAGKFSSNIEVCYASENYSKDEAMVKTMKYAMGFLCTYFLDADLKVISIRRGPPPQVAKCTPIKEAIQLNFDAYNEGISNLLLKSDIRREPIVTH